MNMAKSEVDQRGDARDVASTRVPDAIRGLADVPTRCQYLPKTESLLVLLVELANNQHEHWADTGFEKAKEEALRIQTLKIVAYCG